MGFSLPFFISQFSSIVTQQNPGLGDLRKSCVTSVLVYMDPPQICKLSMLLGVASFADFVWVYAGRNFPAKFCNFFFYAKLADPTLLMVAQR